MYVMYMNVYLFLYMYVLHVPVYDAYVYDVCI